jgi:hypothetical protein
MIFPPSDPVRFTIAYFPDGWRILTAGRPWGRFDYRVDAEEAAIRLARRARRAGRTAEIWVQDMSGRLEGLSAA